MGIDPERTPYAHQFTKEANQRAKRARNLTWQLTHKYFTPLSQELLKEGVLELFEKVTSIASREPFETASAVEIGEWLIEQRIGSRDSLQIILKAIAIEIQHSTPRHKQKALHERATAVLAAVSQGYINRIGDEILDQQSMLHSAHLRVSHDQFTRLHAVNYLNPKAAATFGKDGHFLEANHAWTDLAGVTAEELTHTKLSSLLLLGSEDHELGYPRDLFTGKLPKCVAKSKMLTKGRGEVAVELIFSPLAPGAVHDSYAVVVAVPVARISLKRILKRILLELGLTPPKRPLAATQEKLEDAANAAVNQAYSHIIRVINRATEEQSKIAHHKGGNR
ncbi:hypothetical protein KALB_3740 [Kutzneria albida DSM 43870]|uniref:PAS domain-containing protein n=2 Tax=Kutzneria TaxID=43356 RepID=W5WFZ8_9PSEU|nr:hypothetical protein KALB_3740 [Kutzneria albida DSM 43870]